MTVKTTFEYIKSQIDSGEEIEKILAGVIPIVALFNPVLAAQIALGLKLINTGVATFDQIQDAIDQKDDEVVD